MAMDAAARENFKIYAAALKSMPKFSNGNHEPWRDFEKAWLGWFETNEIGNLVGIPKQKMALLNAMRDRAMRAVDQHGHTQASFAGAATIGDFLKLIRECFNPPSESQTARTDFERRKQGRNEPAVVYLADKKALYYHALPDAASRSFAYFKAEVLKGIYASYVKEKIIEQDPKTEAEMETCVANAVGMGRQLFFNEAGKIPDLDGLASTTMIRATYVDGSPANVEAMDFEDSRRVGDRGTCHTCNKPGHFARDCPKKGSGGSSQARKPNPDKDMICNNCKKKGHRKANCWQLHPELKKGRKGGNQQKGDNKGQKGGSRHRRIADGQDGDDLQDSEGYGDFAELEEDEAANRLRDQEPEHPFWKQAVPRRSGRGNRLN